ncbi:MAG TPA: sugar ABC transporter permease [Caldilineaceae bacterium]|nr:sugar ABC transporter permease [Caldilineaceae bacterium]
MARSWLGSPLQRREAIEGYLWISPWIIGFIVFSLGPIIASLYLSFTEYKIAGDAQWIGLANYEQALFNDKLFWPSLGRTAYYSIATVILGTVLSLLAAMLLNQNIRWRSIFRALYYLPSLTPVVSMAILWMWLLQPEIGLVNYLLGQVGIDGPGWLTSRQWAIPSLIMISLWSSIGGGRMIIFLAGLQGVPKEMHESAEIDGANAVQRFFSITLPMISPVILFNLILGVIGSFGVFSLAYVATDGGPNYATWFYMLHLYYNAFSYFQMGYASALAWIFFLIIFVLSYIQIKLSNRWVYYEFS